MSSSHNSTPSRALPQTKRTDIQQKYEEYLALDDVHDCYFLTKETNPKGRNIFTALYEELPKRFQLENEQIASISASFRQCEMPKEYSGAKLYELPFWCKLCHVRGLILKVMEDRWKSDSSVCHFM